MALCIPLLTYSRLLHAHDKIRMMLRHICCPLLQLVQCKDAAVERVFCRPLYHLYGLLIQLERQGSD